MDLTLSDKVDVEKIKLAKRWIECYHSQPTMHVMSSSMHLHQKTRDKYKSVCSKMIGDDQGVCVFYFDGEASVRLGYMFSITSISIDDSTEPIKMNVVIPCTRETQRTMNKCAHLTGDEYVACGQSEYEVFIRVLYLMGISRLDEKTAEAMIRRSEEGDRKSYEMRMRELVDVLSIPRTQNSTSVDASTKQKRFTTVSAFARHRMKRGQETDANIDIVLLFMNKYNTDT